MLHTITPHGGNALNLSPLLPQLSDHVSDAPEPMALPRSPMLHDHAHSGHKVMNGLASAHDFRLHR